MCDFGIYTILIINKGLKLKSLALICVIKNSNKSSMLSIE